MMCIVTYRRTLHLYYKFVLSQKIDICTNISNMKYFLDVCDFKFRVVVTCVLYSRVYLSSVAVKARLREKWFRKRTRAFLFLRAFRWIDVPAARNRLI